MTLKKLVSTGLAAALICAASASIPLSAAAAPALHGAWKKQTIWYDAGYVEIGRTIHYCDNHLELVGTSAGAEFSQVEYGSCN